MSLSALRDGVLTRCVVVASANAALRGQLYESLREMRWRVCEAVGGADAMAQVELLRPEALLIDSWLPDLEVGEFAWQMVRMYPDLDLLRLDGTVVEGATKSARRHELLHALRQVQSVAPAENVSQVAGLSAVPVVDAPAEIFPGMIGRTAAMLELARLIRLVAPTSATVLIEGETGTGKEVVAQALHRLSNRSAKAFTVLNCAAIPESLLEAELFGHTRGAFTGAVQARKGRIEAADGGTLFLDEIGEMPLALQAKLLRFLECGELQRVGDNVTMRVDVRVIAATHRDLETMAEDGRFRLDLFHRLAVFPLEVPALRERMEDLAPLAEFMLQEMGKEAPRKRLSAGALERLQEHGWPGNVRELGHVLLRGAILAGDAVEIGADEIRLRKSRR